MTGFLYDVLFYVVGTIIVILMTLLYWLKQEVANDSN